MPLPLGIAILLQLASLILLDSFFRFPLGMAWRMYSLASQYLQSLYDPPILPTEILQDTFNKF